MAFGSLAGSARCSPESRNAVASPARRRRAKPRPVVVEPEPVPVIEPEPQPAEPHYSATYSSFEQYQTSSPYASGGPVFPAGGVMRENVN